MHSRWYKKFRDTANCTMKMICFPHAGGSAQDYKKWLDYLPADVDLIVAQMPGRAERIQEKLCCNFDELISHFLEEVEPFLDRHYFLLGHSLGASLAFEIAKGIRRLGYRMPNRLIVISRSGPSIPEANIKYNLPDEKLIDYLKSQSGTDEKILDDREILNFFLPIIRNDIKLADTYNEYYKKEAPLSCPINVLWGNKESNLDRRMIEEWKNETSSQFTEEQFEGNHFFLHEQTEKVINRIFELECVS